jgi:hypothetical protein
MEVESPDWKNYFFQGKKSQQEVFYNLEKKVLKEDSKNIHN